MRRFARTNPVDVDPSVAGDVLGRGRRLFAARRWDEALALLSAADDESPLEPEDLDRLATAAYLTGRDAESVAVWARAHQEFLHRHEVKAAVRTAFRLGFGLLNRGEHARAGGWLARAHRLLDDGPEDCAERGYLLFSDALEQVFRGENREALATFGEAAGVGRRFGAPELEALARHGQGRALLRMGETEEGVALLDEAMAAVEAGEVPPIAAGHIYCSVIEGCHEIFDLRRAREWTAALTKWCESQPGLVPYRGQCLVRRAEILQLHGDWADSLEEARRACEWLSRPPPQRAAGAALYLRAELHRLRGEYEEAEEGYRQASQRGRRPEPGLTQLRLAQGERETAAAAIARLAEETHDRQARAHLLPAVVEITLRTEHQPAARAAADELGRIAAELGAPLLQARAAHVQGAVLLAEGDADAALVVLRPAWSALRELEAPYEAARVRVLIGLAYRELGDEGAAEMELDAARCVFRDLGAAPDLARVDNLSLRASPDAAHGLTPRELQVLRRVAAGETNRVIARALFISERTVDRHVSNIFNKVGVSSRAAATAYAYEHHLVAQVLP